jgi:type IV pilus assembly protein PilN
MVRINLLPVRVSKKKQAGTQQLALAGVVVAAALVGNFWWTSARASALAAREDKARRTRAEIAQLEKIIGEVNDIKQQQAAVKDKLAVLDKLKAGRAGPVRLLDELAEVLPKRLWLRKMEEKERAVTFDGTAATIDDVSAFMAGLGASRHFSGIELKKTAAKTEGRFRIVEFTVTARADYTPPPRALAALPAAAVPAAAQAVEPSPAPAVTTAAAR